MIIDSNRTILIDAQIQTVANQLGQLRTELQNLKNERKAPMPWLENTLMRAVLTDMAIMKIWLENELLVNMIRQEPSIIAEKDGELTYVYLNFLNPEDEALILKSGGKIELKPEPEQS